MTIKYHGNNYEVTLDSESSEYRTARNELLKAEIALKDQRERVAQMRRSLPLGPLVKKDYVFQEGPRDINAEGPITEVHLKDLFQNGKDELICINMMFGEQASAPCPMCNMWADGYDAISFHIEQQKNLVLIAKTEIKKLREWGKNRGWRHIRILSSHDNSFNRDFNVESEAIPFDGPNGKQIPGVTVFKKLSNGEIHHTYSVEAAMAPYEHRGIDLFSPVWNLFDLTPSGRAEKWYPKTSY
jgi:predicted dithiol-disulfide oxidoreductase (DUF899 family)